MKKVLFILLAAGFTFASCDNQGGSTTTETEVVTDTATVVEEKTVEIETEVDTTETQKDTIQQQ